MCGPRALYFQRRGLGELRNLLLLAAIFLATPAAAVAMPQGPAQEVAYAATPDTIETVVVTATRHAEDVGKVAESIGVMTSDRMEALGVRNIADAVRFLPGVSFNLLTNTVSIRGIDSNAGAGTTGVYIDDVPIQMRSLDYSSNNTLPAVFDLDRIEILRGPQGTLFGAGSEGGAVRYITAQPEFAAYRGDARAEASVGANGSWNHEAGLALGGPLDDDLAFRASAWYRHDGGMIDKFDALSGAVTKRNADATDTYVLHGALAWKPLDNLTVVPSAYYQSRIRDDAGTYWVGASDPSRGVLRNGTPERISDRDHFALFSLKVDYQFDGAELISNTSYFSRRQRLQGYSGTIYDLSYFQQLQAAGVDPMGNPCTAGQCLAGLYPLLTPTGFNLPGFGPYMVPANDTNRQDNFIEELRLQSSDPQARLVWTVGIFYALDMQQSIDEEVDPQLPEITQYFWGLDMLSAWGAEMLPNGVEFINDTVAHDRQIAAFANAAYAVTDWLKLQGGLRYAFTRFDFRNYSDGPQNFGYESGTGEQSETPLTWMASATFNATENDMQYVSYSTGYRIGGANAPFPEASCQADLDALGLTSVPKSYNSDRVASFEIGSKDRILGGRLQLDTSIYRMNWSRMQQPNYLSTCGFQYIANFGSAASTGFDLDIDWLVTDALELHATAGFMDAHFTKDSMSGTGPGAAIIARRGDSLPGSPWTFSLDTQYSFKIEGQDAFARLDYEFASHNTRLTPYLDPATTQYDPGLLNDPATNIVSLRIGTVVRDTLVTFFIENLLDSRPQLNLDHMDKYTLLYEAQTLRPRTIGLSASYHF